MLVLCWMVAWVMSAATPSASTYSVTAGNLANVLNDTEKATLTTLALSGTIDARDFKTMRDMPMLETLDLSNVTILSYEGTEGPRTVYDFYPANTIPRNAFYLSTEKSKLTTVIHPSNLKAIGRSAYNLCSGLQNVNLPSGLNNIGILAFYNCRSLASVVIPEGVEVVDTNTFRNCVKLTSVSIPASVRKINATAFMQCSELSQVTFPLNSNLEEIGFYAFGLCPKLVNFTMPSTVRRVANVAFLGTGVVLDIPANHPYLATINGVLYDKALTRLLYCPASIVGRVDIPSSVTSIAGDAFYNCSGMDSVTMPSSLRVIEDWAFENCTGLKTMVIPASVEQIWAFAFYNCSGLKAIYSNTMAPIDLAVSDSVFNYINKNTCSLYVLTGLKAQYQAADKWKEFVNIVEVSDAIPVTAGGLSGLLSTEQKNAMRRLSLKGTIDARDFRTMRDAMPRLEYVDLTQTQVLAYEGTEGTNEDVQYSYAADATPFRAFINPSGNNVLKTILLPAGLKVVGRSSFNRCYALSKVVFPNTLTTIERLGFYNCGALSEINLPNSLTTLGYGAFLYAGINRVVLPEGLRTMDEYAFQSCKSLEQVSIPSTLERIGYCAFTFNDNLRAFTVASNSNHFKAIDGVLYDKTGTILVTYPNKKGTVYAVPEGVTEIDTAAFEGCWVVNRVTLPSTLKRLCLEAFFYCNGLENIQLPAGLTTIESHAFNGCINLLSLRSATTTPIDLGTTTGVFDGVDRSRCLLRVPAGSKASYQQAAIWNSFGNTAEDLAKTLNLTPGTLMNRLSLEERKTVTHLKLDGTIDARDFKTMRDELPMLAEIDLSGVGIVAYNGIQGTRSYSMNYLANAIPPDAFYLRDQANGRRWMSKIIFPASLKEIGDAAFVNTALSELTLNDGLTMLQTYAFYGCRINSVRIPASVKLVADFCFGSNPCLKTIEVDPANAAYMIRDGILYDKAGEVLICYPNAYNKDAFVPDGTSTIKKGAFEGCNLVEFVHLPAALTTIEMPAFNWMGNLRWIEIPSENGYFATPGQVLYTKDMTRLIAFPNQKSQSYQVPEGVVEIGPNAFNGAWNLNEVKLPTTLTKISQGAFQYAENLPRISIPVSVQTIESNAFGNCFNLKYIDAYWITPPSLNNTVDVFENVDKNTCVLRVPAGCEWNYRSMSQWVDFKLIDEVQPITYRVLVPNGTKACYLAGEMNGWKQQAMQQENNKVYRIELMAHRSDEYKYCSGPEWMYEELDAAGNVINNRNYSPMDTVSQWRNVYQPWVPYSPWGVTYNESDQYGKIQMLTQEEGWIANGNDNSLYHTTNGGLSWQKIVPFPNDPTVGFPEMSTSMDWKGPSKGWALKTMMTENDENANGAVIYRTSNAGTNWTRTTLPQAFQPVTYQASDLQGSWQLHQLIFSNNALSQSRYAAWSCLVMNVAADGLLTFSDGMTNSGPNNPTETMHMTVSSNGKLGMDVQALHGFLGRDKQMGLYVVNETSGSLQFGFMQKKQAGITYQASDLAGTWYMYSLSLDNPSDAVTSESEWTRFVLTIDASGNGSALSTDRSGNTETSNFQIQISSEGLVSIPGMDWHGFLSPSKNEMYATMTDEDGKKFDLCMLQKQNPAKTYQSADLAGAWKLYEYSVVNAATFGDNSINAGLMCLQNDGRGTVYESAASVGDESDATVQLAISSGGVITAIDGSMYLHGFMGEQKNTIQYVRYDDGQYVMGVLLKDSTFTGEIGLQIQFADETNGWASTYNTVSNAIRLYRTTNGGIDWQPTTQSPAGFYHFQDANNGWATSGYFTGTEATPNTWSIQHTTDGGQHWKAQYEYKGTNDDALSAIQFTDATHGWVIGDHCRILKSTDAGEHWMGYSVAGLTENDRLSAMFFLDANTGWIAVDGDQSLFILQTLDGGTSWTRLNTNLTEGSINSLYFTDASHGWFTGRTDNQGFVGILDNGTVRLAPLSVKSDWQVYPNPVTTGFSLSSAEPDAQAALYDLNGACLLRFKVETGAPVDISNLKKGIYLLRIKTQAGMVSRKVVKL